MNTSHSTASPQLPLDYIIKHTRSYPEGWSKTYIAPKSGEVLAITGDSPDDITIELSDSRRTNAWTELRISPRFEDHAAAVAWWVAAITAGEARESLAMEQTA